MNTLAQVICGTVLLLGVLAAITVMAIQGSVPGSDAMVAISGIIGIAGGALAVHSGVSAGASAALSTPTTTDTPSS